MDPTRLLDRFIEMTTIESPSFHESEMAQFCKSYLADLGAFCEMDDAGSKIGGDCGNLAAYLPGNKDALVAFCAHMDTVEPCHGITTSIESIEVDGEVLDVIVSSSDTILSADDKCGIAAIFEALETAIESHFDRPSILVILSVCEEQSLLGSNALDMGFVRGVIENSHGHILHADESVIEKDLAHLDNGHVPCFVLDADGRPGSIISKAPCHRTFKAVFHGRAAHAGVEPEKGVSAIEVASQAICNMQLGRLDEATTSNIGMIRGGRAVNIVADEAIIDGECRSFFKDRADDVQKSITDSIVDACEKSGCSVDLEWNRDYDEILYEQDHPLIGVLVDAAKRCGIEPSLSITGGGADANVLNSKGFDAITLGTGMTNFHSTDEFIALRDMEDLTRFVEAIIATYAE